MSKRDKICLDNLLKEIIVDNVRKLKIRTMPQILINRKKMVWVMPKELIYNV